MATVACVNVGNYLGRGAEYVNKLFHAVKNNTTRDFKFACLTDDPSGLEDGIEPILIGNDAKGWWAKMYLFKKGVFPKGERIVFFDLDTLILDNIDELLDYQGEMAGLSDFYEPRRWATGVMLFEAGKYTFIWDEWSVEKNHNLALGDMEFINSLDQGRLIKKFKFLQSLFPNRFASYKADCHPYPPEWSTVLCFHGVPRPHEAVNWAKRAWNEGKFQKRKFLHIEMA